MKNIKINLSNIDFKNYQVEDKRKLFVTLDVIMRRYHQKGYMITSFDPKDISMENDIYDFDKVASINEYCGGDVNKAILSNIVCLSSLACYSYFPDNAVPSRFDTFIDNFDTFKSYFPEEDRDYYKSVLVDAYKVGTLPNPIYYSEYMVEWSKNHPNNSQSNNNVLMKATEVGKMLTEKDEAAFGSQFFIVTAVSSLIIILIGIIYLLIKM